MQFARDAKENELISCFLFMDLRKLHSYMSVILEAVVKCSCIMYRAYKIQVLEKK